VNKVLIESFNHLSDHIRFYEGEVEASTRFTQVPFDHLLFTGSTQVGRIVAQAAAKNLTPVTLELGGKSPTIITEHANLDIAADSVIMGKTFNSGQICVAPDYIFIHESQKERFIEIFVKKVKELFENPGKNDLSSIVNKRHFDRLHAYIKDAEDKGAEVHKTLEPREAGSSSNVSHTTHQRE
jgi:coniferyl-aldehyde dehydrogenase